MVSKHISIKARNLCLCVRMCASNISANQDQTDLRLWLLRGSRVCNVAFVWTTMIPLINYEGRNASRIPLALLTIATIVTCTPEPITAHHSHMCTRANHCRAHPQDKRMYTCSGTSWTGILPAVRSRYVHLNWLLWINETKWVQTESVWVWGDPDTQGQQSGIGICGCSCVASC